MWEWCKCVSGGTEGWRDGVEWREWRNGGREWVSGGTDGGISPEMVDITT